jgi:hypothetical protein
LWIGLCGAVPFGTAVAQEMPPSTGEGQKKTPGASDTGINPLQKGELNEGAGRSPAQNKANEVDQKSQMGSEPATKEAEPQKAEPMKDTGDFANPERRNEPSQGKSNPGNSKDSTDINR